MTVDIEQIMLIQEGIYVGFVTIITIEFALYMLEISLGSVIVHRIEILFLMSLKTIIKRANKN